MKKYIIGFMCGALLASASVVYASDTIKAVLFPVKYEINGVMSEIKDGYSTLYYNGRAYVPLRYIAESLDSVTWYDNAKKTIIIDNGFSLKSISSDVKVGHLNVMKNGNTTKVTGKLYAGQNYWDSLYYSKMMIESGSKVDIKVYLSFYNQLSEIVSKIPITVSCVAKGDQVKDFEVTTADDLSNYSYATLEYVLPEPINAFLPPDFNVLDNSGVVALGQTEVMKSGDYSKIRYKFIILKKGYYRIEGTVVYYDIAGNVLGTAEIKSKGEGTEDNSSGNLNVYQYETAGKGDFTKADRYTLTVDLFEEINSTDTETYPSY